MDSRDAAAAAKASLEGKDMFQSCCTLSIGFSALREVVVKEQSVRSRDFTVPIDQTHLQMARRPPAPLCTHWQQLHAMAMCCLSVACERVCLCETA